MLTRAEALARLEEAIPASGDVFINKGVDEVSYLSTLAEHLRSQLCEPFAVSAEVMEPGFPFADVGDTLHGYCIAHSAAGYWLVYQPDESRFLCFWGENALHLGAHGVFGSPLYCWSA